MSLFCKWWKSQGSLPGEGSAAISGAFHHETHVTGRDVHIQHVVNKVAVEMLAILNEDCARIMLEKIKQVTDYIEVSQMQFVVKAVMCKYHTSNDVFSRCKSVHKMATGKSDDQAYSLTISWNWEQVTS